MTDGPNVILSAFVPDESAELIDWLACHRQAGVSRVRLMVNRKRQRGMALLAALEAGGAVEIVPVTVDPIVPEEIRNSALRCAHHEASLEGGYGLFLAHDEALMLRDPDSNLAALMQGCDDADVLSLPVVSAADEPADAPPEAARRQQELRSVVRLGLFGGRSPEIPTGPSQRPGPVAWVNEHGAPVPAPQTRVPGQAPAAPGGDTGGTARAMVLKAPAWSIERTLLALAETPAADRATPEQIEALLAPFADEPQPDAHLAGRSAAISAQKAALLALPGVTAALAAICARDLAQFDALRAPAPQAQSKAQNKAGKQPPKAAEAPAPDEADATPPTLPPWFAEIHTGGAQQGFYQRLENHAVLFIRRAKPRLVVSFDNLSNVNDLSPTREPWAYKFVRDNECSHLSVMARRKDWYRDRALISCLQDLAASGFFAEFDEVFLTGTSMGGFAALAFSSLAPGATVISFNPQTTLDETLVPWETRFGMGRARDWSLPHSDCAFEIDEIDKAFVFFDPYFTPDRRHVERLEGNNVHLMKTWCSGHFAPPYLRRMDLLKPVMQHAINGTLTPDLYYQMFRIRRTLPWYARTLEGYAKERGHNDLAARIIPRFRKLRRARAAE